MYLNNGVALNWGKKKRKEVAAPAAVSPQLTNNNLFSLQDVSRALRLDRQPPPPPPPPQQSLFAPPLTFTSLLIEDRSAEIVEQSDQIDEIIKTHAEQLRRTLADKWQGHYSTLVRAAEERAAKRLKERELEMEKTLRRNAELEQKAAQFSAEARAWQGKAKKLEETAAFLMAELQKATARGEGGGGGSRVGGCGGSGVAEDAESSFVDPDRVEPVSLACKACERRVATVMMWPCRHVCVCRGCDVVTYVCPVCRSIKTNSLEVFLP